MYPVLLNLRRKRLIINDYLITQAAPLVQIFFPGLAEVGGQVFQNGWGWRWLQNYRRPNKLERFIATYLLKIQTIA